MKKGGFEIQASARAVVALIIYKSTDAWPLAKVAPHGIQL
jgi:hypothetical protein